MVYNMQVIYNACSLCQWCVLTYVTEEKIDTEGADYKDSHGKNRTAEQFNVL